MIRLDATCTAHGASPRRCPVTARNGRQAALTRRTAASGRVVENDDYAAFARRIVAAYARRVGTGDVEALPAMVALSARSGRGDRAGRDRAARLRLLVGRDRHPARRHPPGRPTALGRCPMTRTRRTPDDHRAADLRGVRRRPAPRAAASRA